MITYLQIKQVCRTASNTDINKVLPFLNSALDRYGISANKNRLRAFLSQVLHESGGFHYLEEIASGEAYEGRKDLGNTSPGDGKKYKGRGLIQLTGKNWAEKFTKALGIPGLDFVKNPEKLEEPKWAVESACWFWSINHLNEMADNLIGDAVKDKGVNTLITKKINGGVNGLEDRLKYYTEALKYV